MEKPQPSSFQTRTTLSDVGNIQIITNPVEFQEQVNFLQLPETPLGVVQPSSTTPTALNQTKLRFTNTAPVTVTNLREGQEGQTVFLVGDGFTTLANNSNILTSTGAAKLLADGLIYCFTLVENQWRELAFPSASTPPPESLTVVAIGPVHTFTAATTDENYPNTIQHYVVYDASWVTEYRLLLRYWNATAAGTKEVKLWYSTNLSSWTQLGSTLSSTATNAVALSSFASLPVGARNATVYFRVTVRTNNAPGDVITVGAAQLNFK